MEIEKEIGMGYCGIKHLLAVLALFLVGVFAVSGADREMVAFYRDGVKSVQRDLAKYEVEVKAFYPKGLPGGFVDALEKSKLLYFGKWALADQVFSKPEYCQAIHKFLEKGGVIFFAYLASPRPQSAGWKFFKELGVEIPDRDQQIKGYDIVPVAGCRSDVMLKPNKISGKTGAYGGWRKHGDFTVLMRGVGQPEIAGMMLKDKVAGNGTVILSQATGIFAKKHGGETGEKLMANVLACAFGSVPDAPGERIPVKDPYQNNAHVPNLLYLKAADGLYWHSNGSEWRLPVLVGEPIGMARKGAPVKISFKLPDSATSDSLALYTHWGERLPLQVVKAENGMVDVVFEADLEAFQTRLFLIYCGTKKVAETTSPYGFVAAKEQDGWILRNDKIKVGLYKDKPEIGVLKPVGSDTVNELVSWDGYDPGRANGGWTNDAFSARIAYDGPVMKQILYSNDKFTVRYTLFSRNDSVFVEIKKGKQEKWGMKSSSAWAPQGDTVSDAVIYETFRGIKKLDLDSSKYGTKKMRSYLKEGWLAFADARGDVAGVFFDLPSARTVDLMSHFCNGYRSSLDLRAVDGAVRKGFTARKGSWEDVRDSYIRWKNPPTALIGKTISRSEAKKPEVAEFGKEFIRMIGKAHWYNATFRSKDFKRQVEKLLLIVGRLGGNYVKSSEHRLEFNNILIPMAHGRGFGVDLETGCSACPKDWKKSLAAIENAAAQDCDMIHFMDEYWFKANCDVCKASFKKKYGMDMVPWDENKLSDPAQYNYMFFKMDAIAQAVEKLTNAARKKHPGIKCYMVTSPVNYNNLYKYHDLETMSEWLMSTCSDVYTTRYDYAKYIIKQMRGAQGNNRPYFSVNGCLPDAADTIKNAYMHVMLGANGMWHWVLSELPRNPALNYANAKVFNWLWLTDCGEIFAKARPGKYLAVYRDRAGFIDAIKRGDVKAGQQRIQDLCAMTNVPLNIVYSRHCTLETLKDYRVLIVPANRALPDEKAQIIVDYVKQGGNAIIEGEAIENKLLSSLCGVTVSGKAKKAGQLNGEDAPLKGFQISSPSTCLSAKAAADDVRTLASANGGGAIFERNVGKGKVVYSALTRMPLEWTKLLAVQLGGKRPIAVTEKLDEEVDSNVLADGKRYVLAFHNLNAIKELSGMVKVNLDLPENTVVTDLMTGEHRAQWREFKIDLPPGGFNFILLDTTGAYVLPSGEMLKEAGFCAYSALPGMQFLYLEPVKKTTKTSRKKEAGKIYVGIFKSSSSAHKGPDIGRYAIMESLKKNKAFNIKPEFIEDAEPETLAFYDAVIFPNMQYKAPNLSKDWEKNVRNYVEEGGNVILVHHCAGYASAANAIFPEVGVVSKIVPLNEMEAVADHPVVTGKSLQQKFPGKFADPAFRVYFEATKMKKGEKFESGFPDYMEIKPGKAGSVVVNGAVKGDVGGTPAVVVGKLGKGKVVLSGMDIGGKVYKKQGKWQMEEKTSKGEEAVLVNSIFWLAEKE